MLTLSGAVKIAGGAAGFFAGVCEGDNGDGAAALGVAVAVMLLAEAAVGTTRGGGCFGARPRGRGGMVFFCCFKYSNWIAVNFGCLGE